MEILGALASFTMGVFLGLVGGGGSLLTVPILLFFFGLNPSEATTGSLFVIGLTASLGAFLKARQGQVDFRTAGLFALPGLTGVLITRTWILPRIPSHIRLWDGAILSKESLILTSFAVIMILAAFSMLRPPRMRQESPGSGYLEISAQGLLVGAVTSFVGAGGGFLIVPVLSRLKGTTLQRAVGTSLLVIAINSIVGFFISILMAQPPIRPLFTVALGGCVGLLLGLRWSALIPERKLRQVFAGLVLGLGFFLLFQRAF